MTPELQLKKVQVNGVPMAIIAVGDEMVILDAAALARCTRIMERPQQWAQSPDWQQTYSEPVNAE